MKFYLSSYRIGNRKKQLLKLMPKGNPTIGFIPNALDYTKDLKRRKLSEQENREELASAGLTVEVLDLRRYFGKKEQLQKKMNTLGGVWVRGGNTFVLRQAMKLSGFDAIIKSMRKKDFLYGGYSAGICVLAPDLRGLQHVDDPKAMPYKQNRKIIWEGLGMLNYVILPHYKSNHPESADVDKEVEYCKKHKIPFKTLRDGAVIIIE